MNLQILQTGFLYRCTTVRPPAERLYAVEDNSAFAVTHLAKLGVKRQVLYVLGFFMLKRIIKKFIAFGTNMQVRNMPAFAASVAFYFVLSLFPTLMFICSLIPYLPITEGDLVTVVSRVLPESIEPTIVGVIDDIYRTSTSMIPIMAIAMLWTAAMGIMGLIRGLNGIFEVEDKRNYFLVRGIATLYTLIMIVVMMFMLILVLFGKTIVAHLEEMYPMLSTLLRVLLFIRGFLVWGILAVVLYIAYTFLPAKRQHLQGPGAVIASLAVCVVTWAFTIYIDKFHGFSTYGSMITIMVILFWYNTVFMLIMFGAAFNQYFYPYFDVTIEQTKRVREARREGYSIDNEDK